MMQIVDQYRRHPLNTQKTVLLSCFYIIIYHLSFDFFIFYLYFNFFLFLYVFIHFNYLFRVHKVQPPARCHPCPHQVAPHWHQQTRSLPYKAISIASLPKSSRSRIRIIRLIRTEIIIRMNRFLRVSWSQRWTSTQSGWLRPWSHSMVLMPPLRGRGDESRSRGSTLSKYVVIDQFLFCLFCFYFIIFLFVVCLFPLFLGFNSIAGKNWCN